MSPQVVYVFEHTSIPAMLPVLRPVREVHRSQEAIIAPTPPYE